MKYFINIEGADCSGKTSIAKALASILDYRYEREPTFSSASADELNFKCTDGWQREFKFMLDRVNHQPKLGEGVVLDRYILTGMAYSEVFSPITIEMMKSIYALEIFRKPDYIFIINMDLDSALNINKLRTEDNNPDLNIDILYSIKQAFNKYILYVEQFKTKVYTIEQEFGNPQKAIDEILEILKG